MCGARPVGLMRWLLPPTLITVVVPVVELVLLDDKLNFADTLSKAFEFFKDRCNNRLQITTWDRLQADIKSLVDMSKAKK